MVQSDQVAPYSFREELLNSITHGTGILLSIAALVLLIIFSSLYGSARHIVSCSIFGITLILLYTASTLYHSIQKPQVKRFLKIFDHSCIYFLIAGTYTPFSDASRGSGWTMFGLDLVSGGLRSCAENILCSSLPYFNHLLHFDGLDQFLPSSRSLHHCPPAASSGWSPAVWPIRWVLFFTPGRNFLSIGDRHLLFCDICHFRCIFSSCEIATG